MVRRSGDVDIAERRTTEIVKALNPSTSVSLDQQTCKDIGPASSRCINTRADSKAQ
jgi:hypothetical protein